ncbi:phosphonate ABC transporter substrate-binding protein, partial [Pseudomonas sp. BGM005]|nr:phosphonate ABC transporter substrate-binding protein [Pseudomonas sp. BG5]
FTALPEKDHKCFAAVEGGDYKGYAPVKHEFYNTVVEVRKAAIGG